MQTCGTKLTTDKTATTPQAQRHMANFQRDILPIRPRLSGRLEIAVCVMFRVSKIPRFTQETST